MYKIYICEDRGLIVGSYANLQWKRHQKTLYLGCQLIASLIIMAVVYQKTIEESQGNFYFHECTSYIFVKIEDSEPDLMWIWNGIDIKRYYISATSFVLKSFIVAVVYFCVFVVVDFLLVIAGFFCFKPIIIYITMHKSKRTQTQLDQE